MSVKNKALTKALFSEKELNMDMERGFKGHPNIGSVVMNQLGRSEEFLDIANEFGPEDKIFIISSIFGGTGASGFPVLLKTLRTSDRIPNRGLVNNAPIGAVTVLPYFQVKHDDSSEIDSSTFTSKTKAALSYYHRTLRGMTTTLYYVGDNNPSTYDNHEGSVEQRNNAHFVELMSALAILDFCRETSHDHPLFKEYGIKNKTKEICFNDLGPRSRRLLIGNLTQFMLFTRYFKECTLLRAQAWAKDRRLDSSFFDSNDMVTLRSVQSDFASWLKELSQQERKFMPFDLECPPEKLFSLVTDCEPKWSLKKNYNLFNDRLNSVPTTGGDQMQQLIELFHTATQKLVKEKFNIE